MFFTFLNVLGPVDSGESTITTSPVIISNTAPSLNAFLHQPYLLQGNRCDAWWMLRAVFFSCGESYNTLGRARSNHSYLSFSFSLIFYFSVVVFYAVEAMTPTIEPANLNETRARNKWNKCDHVWDPDYICSLVLKRLSATDEATRRHRVCFILIKLFRRHLSVTLPFSASEWCRVN